MAMGEGNGKTSVLSIGTSRFSDGLRPTVPFAAHDARSFAAGWRSPNQADVLTDDAATTTRISEAFRKMADVTPNDRIIVFLAGLAKTSDGGIQLWTHDGELPFESMLRTLWESPAERVVLLLDLGRGAAPELRIAADDLTRLLPPARGRTLLLADDGRHGSHVSGELQAGIWAAHVTAAFTSSAARSRNTDGTLTAGSLRSFLSDETNRSLARAYTDGRQQAPVVIAAGDDEVILDEERLEASGHTVPSSEGLTFFSEHDVPVKLLGGFRKSLHSPPADTLATSQRWVARLAEPDLRRELEETVTRLRRAFGYKRRDVRADGPQEGAGSVLTPDFAFHIVVRQHSSQPELAVVRRSLDRITNLDAVGRSGVSEVFPRGFTSLHVPSTTSFDLATLIDALEDAEPSVVGRLDYPNDLRFVDLELTGIDGRVRIESSGITIVAPGPVSPGELAQSFARVRDLLISQHASPNHSD